MGNIITIVAAIFAIFVLVILMACFAAAGQADAAIEQFERKRQKRRSPTAVLLILALCFAVSADARIKRSSKVKTEFVKSHPCPSTGQRKLPCPGYIIDHVKPLCAGGPDKASNMQWQTVSEAKEKDRWERKICSTNPH